MGKPYKLILWGLGKEYNSHVMCLKHQESLNEIRINAVTANEIPHYSRIDGWPLIEKEKIKRTAFDYILVMNEAYQDEIVTDIMKLGIERKRILPCRILNIPYFTWSRYIRLLESEISILSNNCWGGIVCHTLGMECRSPFKNLALSAKDLLELLPNLQENVMEKPEFVEFRKEVHSGIRYPVMRLKNAYIHFNHDTSVEEALEKWNRRLKKINYNNLFVEIYTEDRDVVEHFISLKTKKKACFVPRGFGIKDPNVYELEMLPGQKEFWEVVNSNVSNGANSYLLDIISLLAGEKKYRVD